MHGPLAPRASWVVSIEDRVAAHFASRHVVWVLEAGGGSKRSNFQVLNAHVTVVDIDPNVLALNSEADEKVLADLQRFDAGDRRFDLIVCWDVLEHVPDPDQAITRLCDALRSGGLLIVKGPVLSSMKGLVTRLTPHRVHVWFYRYVLGSKNAGQPGYAPFPVEHASGADDRAMLAMLTGRGMNIVAWQRFQIEHVAMLRAKAWPLYLAYRSASAILQILTLGRYGTSETDFYLIATPAS